MRPRALTALTRFGLGPRPGDYAAIQSDPVGYVRSQCFRPEAAMITRDDLRSLPELRKAFNKRDDALFDTRRASRAKGAGAEAEAAFDAARLDRRRHVQRTFLSEVEARFDHGVATDNPFIERLVLFWANHFTVDVKRSPPVRVLAGNLEREVIRPNVLGYFSDMLLAAATHPAMLIYLDNWRSIGPNSRIGRRRRNSVVNENLAREILELHTMGSDGGYTQKDVIALAETLTGWTGAVGRGGRQVFDPRRHEHGPRTILGKNYPPQRQEQLYGVLLDLAAHPSTARHLSRKLARHFIADDVPEALIEELTATYLETGGDLREMALVLVESEHAWQGEAKKTVPPYDFMVAAMRATGARFPESRLIVRTANQLAQDIWSPPSPAGWPSDDSAFLGGDSLLERVDFARVLARKWAKVDRAQDLAVALCGDSLDPFVAEAVDRAEDQHQALVLLLMSPVFHRR